MKILLSWMKEFAPEGFGDIEADPAALGDVLTNLGLVVESIEHTGNELAGVVMAKVLSLNPHPDADSIQLVEVDTGGLPALDGTEYTAGEPLQICCGAFNMSVGDIVPLATLGTVMPSGMEIARRKLRGEWSNGMLCSATELGVGEDADGILLMNDHSLGQTLIEALEIETDVLFDLDVEGNRPDALSVAGVARDLCAKLKVPFAFPEVTLAETEPAAAERTAVIIEDNDLCKRFGARVLDNVTMGPSPAWMQRRLEAAGQRPINVIVDISNYVMLERGQPNHTFDLDTVPDGAIRVRMANDGEALTTLDDQQRTLTSADGLVCNGAGEPISLAGVMGGLDTEISDTTTSVLLEAAVWDRMTIAKTSRRLNLRSEASTRFERGADPMGIERALDRFCQLAVELAGCTVAAGRVIVDGGVQPAPEVGVRVARVNHILNTALDADTIEAYLSPIGFETLSKTADELQVRIPSWRPDSSVEIDVIEEIGRHHGYEKSGKRVPTPEQAGELTEHQLGRRRIRRTLLGAGFSEAMPMPFLAPGDLAQAGLDEVGISLANPLVHEESILRTSMLPGLLKSIAYNQSHRNPGAKLYEVGQTFLPSDEELPVETEWVAAIWDGADATKAVHLLHQLAASLGLKDLKIVNGTRPGLHPTRAAEIQFRGRPLGEVGEVDPGVLEAFDIDGRVGWLQLQVAPITNALANVSKYKKISRFPSSDLDLAFVVPNEVPASDLIISMKKAGGPLLKSVELFDVFRSDAIGADARSLAYRLRIQADDRTLDEAEHAELQNKIIKAVKKANKAELR